MDVWERINLVVKLFILGCVEIRYVKVLNVKKKFEIICNYVILLWNGFFVFIFIKL